jgi:hypothetical protein
MDVCGAAKMTSVVTPRPARWEAQAYGLAALQVGTRGPAVKIYATGEEDLCICCHGGVDGGVVCMLVHDWLHISRWEVLRCRAAAVRFACAAMGWAARTKSTWERGLPWKTPD